ncbi:MAG TPA: hypothetical protein DG048_08565 [Pseudoalteromonas sp.]|nr:hypothetical protein [Pseudoalteromonas sp.]|tara:strand:+ start:598 stop:1017 length:420 start_codon:yes stop_codon:yes gene_type:complete
MADIPFTNPTPSFSSSNPTGTGTSINYIGKHAFAYSGEVTSGSGTAVTMMQFTVDSGSYIVGKFQVGFGTRANDDELVEVIVNGATVAALNYNNSYERAELNDFQVLLPAFSEVIFKVTKLSGTADVKTYGWFQGEVYA